MKYLGIDYGTKKIGLAVSDERGKIAFPKNIISNSPDIVQDILDIVEYENIEKIVIGKSLDPWGSENLVQKHIDNFIKKLSYETKLDIVEQDERLSSVTARSHLYGKGNIKNEQWSGKQNKKRREAVDAGAAAVILQRYLDAH
ncbi:MAG: Holliday junction resolvase RuvX [Candidatus Pacebacteria bacterium]|nr:Holliday junction resolvase RuvX [Candidatus Paceibacterota bacterium]